MNNVAAGSEGIPPGSIVVGVGESSADDSLHWAAAEARMTGRAVSLVHVVRPLGTQQRASLATMGVAPSSVSHDALVAAKTRLDEIAASLHEQNIVTHLAAVEGDPRDVLAAMSQTAFRVVVGSRGHGVVASRLLGSVGAHLVRYSGCPAVVVRPTGGAATTPGVVVSASPTAEGQATLEAAFLEAEARQCELIVVAFDPDGIPQSGQWSLSTNPTHRDALRLGVAEAVAGLQEDHPDVAVSTSVTEGSLLHALLELGGHRELLVIERPAENGRRAHFGVAGSLAAAVVEHASTTVMVVA